MQAGRLRNPGFSIGRARRGNDVEVEWTLVFDVLGLVTMPWRTGIERQRFEAVQMQAAAGTLRVAADAPFHAPVVVVEADDKA